MVISIAMLGMGSAGTILYAFLIKKSGIVKNSYNDSLDRLCSDNRLSFYAAMAGIFLVSSYVISNYIPFDPARFSWENMQFFYLALYCVILSLPFFFAGILIASVFIRYSHKSSAVYGFDLLGAGIGSIIVLSVLNVAGPEYAVLISSSSCLLGSLLLGKWHMKVISSLLIFINLLIVIVYPDFIKVNISPYKSLPVALTYPGAKHIKTYHSSYSRIDVFKSPAVRFAPGLSFKYSAALPDQLGLAIDGDRVEVITYAGDREALKFLEFLPSSLGFELSKKEKVLVIDPKGGLHLLMSEHYGFRELHGVESNPLLAKIINDDYKTFTGGIYGQNIRTGYGRNFLSNITSSDQVSARYDLIDIPIEGTSVSGVFGISEDYKYTTEAFNKYLSNLNSDGLLSISLYLIPPPRKELRIISTIISVLKKSGYEDPSQRLAAIRSWDSMTILAKKSPFTENEINKIKEFARVRQFDLVYYPGISEDETNINIKMSSNIYYKHFSSLLDSESSSLYIDEYLFDIRPVNDDNPFFYYFLKLKNIGSIYDVMGRKWLYFIQEGYLLPVIFGVIFVLSIILIILPLLFNSSLNPNTSCFLPCLVYFSMIGIAFMFIEVAMIQKSILVLENPSFAVGSVLTSLLISSGTGSLFSLRYHELSSRTSIIILCLLIVIYNYAHPILFNFISSETLLFRVSILSISLFPLGFLMGIPFPMGMKLIGEIDYLLIPWAWSVNAFLSVLAPIMTTMIAVSSGFNAVFWLAVLSYIIAFISFGILKQAQR